MRSASSSPRRPMRNAPSPICTAFNRKRSRSVRLHNEQTTCRFRSACDSSALSKNQLRVLSHGASVRSTTLTLWPRTASPIRCPTVRFSQTPAGSRPSFTIPRLPDIAECIALPVCIVSAGRHSRESDQRRSLPARGIHPRACREPASPFGGSRCGFPPVNWRDPIRGLTELPSPGVAFRR
jgi:hypothetical protein